MNRSTSVHDTGYSLCGAVVEWESTRQNRLRRHCLGSHPGNLPDAYVLPFDSAHWDIAEFARFGIDCPRAVQRSVPTRQAEYLAGRRAALAALRDLGSDATDLAISTSRAPAWPEGFLGSVTHTHGVAVAVALPCARACGIGIDIECVASGDGLEAIAATAIDAGEQRILGSLERTFGRGAAYTIAFSAKESFFKATYGAVGYIFDFNAIKVRSVSPEASTLSVEVVEQLARDLPVGMRLTLGFTLWEPSRVFTTCRW